MLQKNGLKVAVATTVLLLSSINVSKADSAEDTDPIFSADVVVEVQSEYAAHSDDEAREHRNNIFLRTEVAPTVRLGRGFYVDGVLVLEPVQDFDEDEHNYFEETGIFVEEIKINYENGPWSALVSEVVIP